MEDLDLSLDGMAVNVDADEDVGESSDSSGGSRLAPHDFAADEVCYAACPTLL